VVVCGDMLEHIPDPELILKWLIKLQTPEAFFYLSLKHCEYLDLDEFTLWQIQLHRKQNFG